MQATLRPSCEFFLELFARMGRSVINDDPRLFLNQAAKDLEAMRHRMRVNRALEDEGLKLPRQLPQESQDILALAPGRRHLQPLAHELPRIGDGGQQAKAGLVVIIEVATTGQSLRAQVRQLLLRRAESLFVALVAQAAAHPLPDQARLLQQAFEGLAPDPLAGLPLDGAQLLMWRARFFPCQLERRLLFLYGQSRGAARTRVIIQSVRAALFPPGQPSADGVAVHVKNVGELGNRVALLAQQDGVRAAPRPETRMRLHDLFQRGTLFRIERLNKTSRYFHGHAILPENFCLGAYPLSGLTQRAPVFTY